MNFYPFHIGDYASHTNHLTDAEDLAYRRMIDLYYQSEKPFVDVQQIARRVRSTPEIVQAILTEFFEKTPDGYVNNRCDKEIAKYHFLSESGKKGAEKRWGNKGVKPTQSIPNSPPITTSIATKNQEPLTKNHIKPMKASPSVDLVFEEAWNAYPKRPGASKQGSIKAWKARIKAGVDTQKILLGVKRYAEYCKASGIDPQFIKQPSTFFGPDEHYLADWTPLDTHSHPKELPLGTDKQIEHAYRVECGGDPTKARFNSYFEMKNFVLKHRDQKRLAA